MVGTRTQREHPRRDARSQLTAVVRTQVVASVGGRVSASGSDSEDANADPWPPPSNRPRKPTHEYDVDSERAAATPGGRDVLAFCRVGRASDGRPIRPIRGGAPRKWSNASGFQGNPSLPTGCVFSDSVTFPRDRGLKALVRPSLSCVSCVSCSHAPRVRFLKNLIPLSTVGRMCGTFCVPFPC